MIVGVGVDLVRIARIRAAIERWQDRFLERVFTPDEVAYARGRRDPAEHLAARFAAKEAALKALGTGLGMGVRWRELEVQRARGERPRLALSGRTAALGAARGVRTLHLSLSHDGEYALAHVLAEGEPPAPGRRA
ncbi:MAG TPA: holo-ACP synthase [Methylomirabilota bacterium]|jgi:holo-[acyl-carrier protein] synthase|nr:holo-ACP synthase [Methylomirabilota bacterium]